MKGSFDSIELPGGFIVAAWRPDPEGSHDQVHLTIDIGDDNHAFVIRFKSPYTLRDLIQELIEYRREVWPECELIIGDKKG